MSGASCRVLWMPECLCCLVAGLYWCYDAWLWSCRKALHWTERFYENAQLFIHRRIQRVVFFIHNVSPFSRYMLIAYADQIFYSRFKFVLLFSSGCLFSILQPTQNWSGCKKKRYRRKRQWKKDWHQTKTGQVKDLWKKVRAWFPTDPATLYY